MFTRCTDDSSVKVSHTDAKRARLSLFTTAHRESGTVDRYHWPEPYQETRCCHPAQSRSWLGIAKLVELVESCLVMIADRGPQSEKA